MKFTLLFLFLLGAAGAHAQPVSSKTTPLSTRNLPSPDGYLSAMKERLAINNRNLDPFGLSQDLKTAGPTFPDRPTHRPTGPTFADIVASIRPSALNLKDQIVLFGFDGREFRKGETFPLVTGQERFTVRIESITGSAITLANLKTGERAAIKVDLLWKAPQQDDVPLDGIRPDGDKALLLPAITAQP